MYILYIYKERENEKLESVTVVTLDNRNKSVEKE